MDPSEEIMVDEDGILLSPHGEESDNEMAGFEPASPIPDNVESIIALRRRDLKREEKWWHMLQEWEVDSPPPSKMKSRARKGVPKCLRGQVWPRLALNTGGSPRPTRYSSLVMQDTPFEDQIRKDIGRTFPRHVWFKHLDGKDGAGQAALLRVLRAFAVMDPDVGYTQGMGFVTGQFLLHMSEENAFLLLVQLSERYGMADMWRAGFPRLMEDMWVFEKLLHDMDPELAVHLRAAGMEPALYCVEWFMTLFSAVLPTKCVCRVWDMLFCEGCDKAIFRTSLALLVNRRDELLTLNLDGLMQNMKKARMFRPILVDPDEFVAMILETPLRTAHVVETRELYAKLQPKPGMCPW
eukprot:TRINITY_DN54968_c0_g1_i2.p1 TRINITY_DN54968_c0_g1~~TRINITY_DN54968_c0_g1_i2.p1  ORF type:complete len:352 (+),score=87.06 TRINITY_DN54968_c0_g1_i2:167-1222(+)